MKISYIFPSRSRPEKCIAALENIISLSRHNNYDILVTADVDDDIMFNRDVRDRIMAFPNTKVYYGNSKTKIEAINRDVPFSNGDIICIHSDDMVFIKEGFDLEILQSFSDGFKGLVHFPDQQAKEQLITYPIMHREYYKIDGYIYNPDFLSVYADNFQQFVAKARGMYKFIDTKILQHRHVVWGFGASDELMKRNEDPVNYAVDKKTYERLVNEFHT